MNKSLRAKLVPCFQRKLFTNAIKKNGIQNLCKEFNLNHSVVYHYRNNRINSINFKNLRKVAILSGLGFQDVEGHIISVYDSDVRVKSILDRGRSKRLDHIKFLVNNLPSVEEIVSNCEVNFERWFNEYVKLYFSGIREVKEIKIKGDVIFTRYSNFSNGIKKEFVQKLPRNFVLDDDFQYFLGLWLGDRVGKGRFGVANKDKKINLETARILRKFFQEPIFDLNISNGIPIPVNDFNLNKIIVSNSKRNIKGYCFWVYSNNSILFSFFDYLVYDLDMLLSFLPNKAIFFAGLFDAEGNVCLDDFLIRWACCNDSQVGIYKKHLIELGLFNRYDGSSLISKNIFNFKKLIFPYIKHPQKINDFSLLVDLGGVLPKRFEMIVNYVKNNPGIRKKELAKALNKVKIYSQVKFLEKKGYLMIRGYPHQLYVVEGK